ncbi:hypothetical protein PAPH110629_04950 [Paenibacillus phoenicis]
MGFAGSGRRLKCSSDRCCSRISLVGLDSEVVEIRSQRRTSGPDPACIYVQKCERIPAGDSASEHAVTYKAPLLLSRLAPKVSVSRRDNASLHVVSPVTPQSRSPRLRRSATVERARRAASGSSRLRPPGCAESSSPEQHGLPGHPGAPKVRRTRRGKSVPRANLSDSPQGRACRSASCTPAFFPFAGDQRAAGPRTPSLTVRERWGGLRSWLRSLRRHNFRTPQSSTPGSAHNTSTSTRPSKHADAGQGSQ